MPKVMPLFLINRKLMQNLIKKLLSSGLNKYNNFIDLSGGSGKFNSYLITVDTLLRAELTYEPVVDKYTYKLFYNDIEISELSYYSKNGFREAICSIKNLDRLPKSLIKSEELLAREKQLEEKNSDILIPIGNTKPSEHDMLHLSFLNLSSEHYVENKEQKQFFIKLPKNKGFSYRKHFDVSAHQQTEYFLQYHGKEFAEVIEKHIEDTIWLWIHPLKIALARGNPENILRIPYLEKRGSEKIRAHGTIESCYDLIKNNKISTFIIKYSSLNADQAKTLNYKGFDHEKLELLVDALKHNSTLEELYLPALHLLKDDFLKLVLAVKNIKSCKLLDITNSYVCITLEDMPEIQKTISNVNIEFSGVKTDDKTYPSMKGLMKAHSSATAQIVPDKKSNVNIVSPGVSSLIIVSWEKSKIITSTPVNLECEEPKKEVEHKFPF
jgi:hypothetical protein